MLEFEYARSALQERPEAGDRSSASIPTSSAWSAVTDAHTGLAAVDEDNFFGKTSSSEPSPKRATHPFMTSPSQGSRSWAGSTTASGYAAVWAHGEHARVASSTR